MNAWQWVRLDVVYAVHDCQLAEHGGLDGIRDQGAIESALERPKNLENYAGADAADLAASYAYGLARNHGFSDGNKRTAWIIARLFLMDNDYALRFNSAEAVMIMLKVAAGDMEERQLAEWFRQRLTKSSGS